MRIFGIIATVLAAWVAVLGIRKIKDRNMSIN